MNAQLMRELERLEDWMGAHLTRGLEPGFYTMNLAEEVHSEARFVEVASSQERKQQLRL